MSNMALRSSRPWYFLRPVAFSLLALLVAVPAIADSHARIVRLSYVDGDIEIDKADGHGFTTAYLNMPIAYQSKVWARDGQAEVEFEDGSSIRLTPDTIVGFTDLSLDSDGRRTTQVTLQQGTAYFDIRHRDADTFEVDFSHERAQLSKSARFRVDAEKGSFELATMKGEVQVSSGTGTEVAVKSGEAIRIDSDDPDRYYLSKEIDAETYDGWDNERASSHDQAVSAAADSGYNRAVYGMSDLANYGNYFYVPGYGYMWRPNSVGLGWDPFDDGYWISYPSYGYMFVSSYPWGWAPYRYGSWQFVNGYGWCWAPGSNWNSWNTAPVYVSGPPHFRPPERPRHGSPTLIVTHGVATAAPTRQIIVDNDSLNNHRPHSSKIVTTDGGVVIRQGQPGATVQPGSTVPAQGFVSSNGTPAPSTTPAPAMPGTVIVAPVREPHGGGHGGEVRGGAEFNQGPRSAPPAPPARTASVPAAVGGPPVHSDSHVSPPRMDSHGPSAPAMHSGGPFGGGGMHSAGPSFSAPSMGAGHSGGGFGGGGGGGGHSGGGGGSGGSHH